MSLRISIPATMYLAIALGAAASLPARGAERAGEIAVGFSNADAPLACRVFVTDGIAVDAGLGCEFADKDYWATAFFLETGVTVVLAEFDASFLFFRPAGGYQSLDDRMYGRRYGSVGEDDAQWHVWYAKLNLGAEVRLAERFGLTFQHGLSFEHVSVPALPRIRAWVGTDKLGEYRTFGENVTEAGVWFTF